MKYCVCIVILLATSFLSRGEEAKSSWRDKETSNWEEHFQFLMHQNERDLALDFLLEQSAAINYKGEGGEKYLYVLQQAQLLATDLGKDSLKAHIVLNLARAYENNQKFGASLLSYLKAAELFKEVDEVYLAHTFTNIGELFFKLEEYNMSADYFLKALTIKQKYPFKCNLPFALWCMAEVHYAKGNQDSSWYYYEKSSLAADTIRQIPYYGNEGLAQLLIDRKEYQTALDYLIPVRIWYEEVKVPMWEADMGLLYMKIYAALRNDELFKYWSVKTKQNAYNDFLPEQQERYHLEMYSYFKNKKDNVKALLELEQAVQIQKELNEIKNQSSLGTLLVTLKNKEAELKDAELKHVQKSNDLLKSEGRLVYSTVLLLLSILCLTVVFYFLLVRKNKKISSQLVRLEEKDRQLHRIRMKAKHPVAILNAQLVWWRKIRVSRI